MTKTMSETDLPKCERILGVPFFRESAKQAVEQFASTGGYMVVPASPALINLQYDREYQRALQNADLALPDSALLVFLWRFLTGRELRKISGITYLRCLLERSEMRTVGTTFWIVGSGAARTKAGEWLGAESFQVGMEDFHIASQAGAPADDHDLLLKIEQKRPSDIVIALGAGVQEKLGSYLREYLLYRPRIHCVGAALGFLSGYEHSIPDWAERLRLGWLFRLAAQPGMLFPRIGIAFVLARMLIKYRSNSPPLKQRWAEM